MTMSDANLFQRMGHVGIQVANVQRALEFYRDCLGFRVQWDGSEDWANVSLGGDDLGLIRKAEAKHPPHLGLRVQSKEDLQKAHAQLQSKGIPVEPLKGHRDGSISFYFRDPDDNILEALWMPPSKATP